jgi:hypothetical protein
VTFDPQYFVRLAEAAQRQYGMPLPSEGAAPQPVAATPFVFTDPAAIPKRPWIYGTHLCRENVTLTVAPGGTGKSALVIADALAMVTGRNLLGKHVHGGAKRVWLWNLEDPRDELQRRITAAMLHYGIAADALGERLFVDSGRDQGLCIAHHDRSGVQIEQPLVEAVVAELQAREIDVLVVDPFVSSHQVPENDNGAIDAVAKTWARIASRANCAVELVHHVRKGGGEEAEGARGAVALVDAARSARVLRRMDKDEAEAAGIPEDERRRYVRSDDAKANLAPPAGRSDWIKLESYELPNGDNVGVVVPWAWPDVMEGLDADDLLRVQRALHGQGFRKNQQAERWAGHEIGRVLGIDTSDKAGRKRAGKMLDEWLRVGALVVVDREDEHRKPRPIVEVGEWVSE